MILLDTDVVIDLIRQHPPALAWLESLGDEKILLSGFTVMEIIQGCRTKAEQERTERQMDGYVIVWPSEETCATALLAFSRYRLSHGIGILDALIGQLAVALNLPLHTFNQKHYAAIPGLKTVQPYNKES